MFLYLDLKFGKNRQHQLEPGVLILKNTILFDKTVVFHLLIEIKFTTNNILSISVVLNYSVFQSIWIGIHEILHDIFTFAKCSWLFVYKIHIINTDTPKGTRLRDPGERA